MTAVVDRAVAQTGTRKKTFPARKQRNLGGARLVPFRTTL
jgi:hypothetical protein